VPSSSSSSAQQARQALADQLREIRLAAGLTGRALASEAGWHGMSKVSKIVVLQAEEVSSRAWKPSSALPTARLVGKVARLAREQACGLR
jgi:hypothetical protein